MPEPATPPAEGAVDYIAVQESVQFRGLRRTHRSFVFPLAIVSLAWYLVFVLLAAYAPDLMAIRLSDNITLGLVLGLSQFAWVFIVTAWYVWYANRKLDPPATELREELERVEAGA